MNECIYFFQGVLIAILSMDSVCTHLTSRFQEFTSYADTLYFTWKLLPILTPKKKPSEVFIENYLALIQSCPLPKIKQGVAEENNVMMCGMEGMQ